MPLFEKAVSEFNETVAGIEQRQKERGEALLQRMTVSLDQARQADEQCVQNAQGHQEQIRSVDASRAETLKTVNTALEEAKTEREKILETLEEVKQEHLRVLEKFREQARMRIGGRL